MTLTLPGEKVNDLELPVNVYRQLGNTALKAEVEEQSDLDAEAALQRGLALLEAQRIDPLL
ncbi:hypothetical protein [Arsenophonus sp. PmNCSU2021_1]|uniref:hypothetical protein n=1 Tax=Arsenophonus sp. PmNCSU2021_1 TaxID=3118989 RepID=UPI002FF1142C